MRTVLALASILNTPQPSPKGEPAIPPQRQKRLIKSRLASSVVSYAQCLNVRLMMHRSTAETLALKGLGHLAADGEALVRFLRVSGLEIADLRSRAGHPELLAAVLDFLLSDDKL